MSERVMPRDAINQKTVMADDDQVILYNKGQDRNDNAELVDMRTYYQDDLPGLKDGTTQANPRSFTSGRFDSKELTSISLASGDWNIAQLENVADGRATARFKIVDSGGTTTIEAGIKMSTSAKTHSNTTIEIIERSGTPPVSGVKIGKSDSVNASGALITITLSSASIVTYELIGNTGSGAGFEIITAVQGTTLPDGVTVGTFLEAGEELSFDDGLGTTIMWPSLIAYKASNDQLRCVVDFPEIPKQGTGLTLTLASTLTQFNDGSGNTSSLSSFTISNFSVFGNRIKFFINQTGVATSLNTGFSRLLTNGTGCKLTIT